MSQIESNPAKAANAQVNPTPALGWDVFVTPGIPIVTIDLPPGITQAYFQAMASTLIYGARDAVLVDAFMTVKQANKLDCSERQEPYYHLHYTCPRRPLVWSRHSSGTISERQSRRCEGYASEYVAGVPG